jgi:hypothetical protein
MPDDPPIPSVPDSRTVPKKQTRLSLVWIIPVMAAALGAWVAVTRIMGEGFGNASSARGTRNGSRQTART